MLSDTRDTNPFSLKRITFQLPEESANDSEHSNPRPSAGSDRDVSPVMRNMDSRATSCCSGRRSRGMSMWASSPACSVSSIRSRYRKICRDSQEVFSTPEHTFIVFDWDDTLFPTHWIGSDERLDPELPLDKQEGLNREDAMAMKRSLAVLQQGVINVLDAALKCGHVVIVTLASSPWVELSCENFFPRVGRFLKKHGIKIVYAQDVEALAGNPTSDGRDVDEISDPSDYWIQVKQRAIMGEITAFYGNSGSSWKNIISVGDSNFERYATQAALFDYAVHGDTDLTPTLGLSTTSEAVLKPSESRTRTPDNHAVSGLVNLHYRRLRCKTIKMFDSPTIEDLHTEMGLLVDWMPHVVKLDAGFDIDLEDNKELYDFHFNLTGKRLSVSDY